jgi:hypothetical protein
MNAPPSKRSNRESYHDIIDGLCGRYMGLSPIEVMNSDFNDVYDLYVDVVIKDYNEKHGSQKGDQGGAVWVTSKTATWH